jgi:hypothetical protein
MEHIVELDSLQFPVFSYKRHPNCALTPTNLFGLAFGLYMISAPMMGWIDYNSPSLASALCFAGVCEYLIGFYNWYDGRALQSFMDFVFGLLFLTIYYTSELGKYSIPVPYEYHTYMQGVFYCLWLAMLFALIIGLMGRGFMYLINIFLIALGFIFVLIWHFSKKTWARKTSGYILFVAACLIFITGILVLMNGILKRPASNCVHPYP